MYMKANKAKCVMKLVAPNFEFKDSKKVLLYAVFYIMSKVNWHQKDLQYP